MFIFFLCPGSVLQVTFLSVRLSCASPRSAVLLFALGIFDKISIGTCSSAHTISWLLLSLFVSFAWGNVQLPPEFNKTLTLLGVANSRQFIFHSAKSPQKEAKTGCFIKWPIQADTCTTAEPMFTQASVHIRTGSMERLMGYCLCTIDYLNAIFPSSCTHIKK